MASKRKQRRKQCLGKKPYIQKIRAIEAACNARARTHDDIHWYRCCSCGMYHIGHRTARKF